MSDEDGAAFNEYSVLNVNTRASSNRVMKERRNH